MKNDILAIELDRVRTVKFNIKALKMIEKVSKVTITAFNPHNLNVDQIMNVLLIGLSHEDPSLTIDKLIDLVDEANKFGEVYQLIIMGVMKAFGNNIDDEEEDNKE